MENSVVIINNNLKTLEQFSEIIKDLQFKPLLFHDVAEGLKYIERSTPYLLITDIFFSEYSPEEYWKILKSLSVAPILIVSDKPSNEFGPNMIRDGAIDYLLTPIEREQIRFIFAKLKLKEKRDKFIHRQFITNNAKMLKILKVVEVAAKSKSTVFIRGESGVGKELIARMIHEKSNRSNGPFVAVNCAALPENLLESELFGHEKGSFTGAINTKLGKFELADTGTILLDEITEMSFPLQAKLLRVLQEREIDRIGGREPIKIDIRVIATTNRDIKKIIDEGNFRDDLYYRLNVIPVLIPPLRERKDDISILGKFFIEKHCMLNQIPVKSISEYAIKKLQEYDWPGNVRELENIIERAVIVTIGNIIDQNSIFFEDDIESIYDNDIQTEQCTNTDLDNQYQIPHNSNQQGGISIKPGTTISEMEKKLIVETLKSVNLNRTLAAELLGITVRTLRNKLNEYKEFGIIL